MPFTTFRLGNIVFEDFAIPEELESLGGKQNLAVMELVGPDKIVQVLGPKPNDISWQGVFCYTDAISKARQVDQLRISGEKVRMSWAEFSYDVIVKQFDYKPHHQFEIPYSITLEVLKDPQGGGGGSSVVRSQDQTAFNSITKADTALIGLASNPNFSPISSLLPIQTIDDVRAILATPIGLV